MKEKLFSLGTLTDMRARLLHAMLERHGIESTLVPAGKEGKDPARAEVMVDEKDFQEASDMLDDFKSAYGEEKKKVVDYMQMARRILVPVDYSLHAENAAFYALNIASVMKSEITLLNVYLDPNLNPFSHLETFTFASNLEQITTEVEEKTDQWLKTLAGKLKERIKERKIKGVEIRYDLAKDNVLSGIMEYVRIYEPGLVVMGTRGTKREGMWSFGSTTAKAIERLKIPVLAIPKGFDARERRGPARIVFITGFDDADYGSLSRLATFALPFHAQIYCLHIAETPEKKDEANMQHMRKFIAENLRGAEIECFLRECQDLQMCLEDFVKERSIDMIAVTTPHRNLFTKLYHPGLTRKVLFHTEVPLLVFHAGAGLK